MLLFVWIVDDSFEMSERSLCKTEKAREMKGKKGGKGEERSV